MLERNCDGGDPPHPASGGENTLDRERVPSGWRTLEIVGLSLSVPLLGTLLKVQDPFFLHGTFPWLVLVPLLIALQHGLGSALVSALLLCSGVVVRQALGVEDPPGVWTWTAGCFLIALLAGWFKDQSLRRERDLGARSREIGERWQRLTRAHRVLELSHSQLEDRLIAQGWSLESVVRRAGAELASAATPASVYALVLDVLASQAQLLTASFFAPSPLRSADSREPVRLDTVPAASLGKPACSAASSFAANSFAASSLPASSLPASAAPSSASLSAHPIVRRSLLTREVALLAPEPAAQGVEESVLAALPLVTSSGRLLGVVAVHEMPFLAFTPATFSELDTILRGLADLVDARLSELRSSAPPRVKLRSGVRLRSDDELTSFEATSLDARLSAAVGDELPPDSSAPRVGGRRG